MTDPAPKAKIPNNCVWEDTFWESDRFLSYALHFLTSIEIPLHCFGAYLIIFKTPKTMKTAKFSILQLHIVCAVMDLMITSLWAFYLWWPCPAGYPVGLMSSLGVDSTLQTFIVLNVMLAAALSYISLFENRYDVVVVGKVGRSKRRNLYRILYFSLNIIYIQCSLLYVYLFMPEKEDARKNVHFKNPCMPIHLINNPHLMDLNAGTNLIPFIAFFLVIVLLLQGLYFIAYTTYFLFTNVKAVSPATRRMQRKFFIAMFLQALIPGLSFAAPLYGYQFLFSIRLYNQTYNNLLMIAIGCNGLFTTLVMILVHHPYRKAVCEIIATRRLNGLNATAQPLRSFIINRHVAMIPCPAGYPVGLMSSIGIDSTLQSFIAQTVMLAVAISYISLFENRYDVVVVGRVGRSKRRNLYRAIFFLLNIIYVESTLGYIYYHLPEKEDARAHVHKLQPCIPMAMINHPNFMDLNAGSYTIPFVSGSMVVIICIQAIYFLGYTTYCLFTNVQNVSNHTRKVQKKFFLAMFLQAAIPAVSFAAPLYGYSLLYKFDYFDQMYNNLLMIAIGCNGLFSTVAMILVHHPYRNAALDMIRMRKLNGLNSAIGTFNLRPIITEKNLVVVSG